MASKTRRPYRVPLGLPGGREDWRIGSVISTLVHLAIIIILFSPLALMGNVVPIEQGGGGPGPAGGGGGGNRGSGRLRAEVLKFVRVAPPLPAPAPPKAVVTSPPPPVVPPTPQPQAEVPKMVEPTMTVGVGGGTGTDQTAGAGPGSGGGVGTGTGTGRGSATGPGTGGGTQANYAPTAIEMLLPPLPVPSSARGKQIIAEFDVDASGKVLSVTFTETKDRGYNRRLGEALRGYRFRPGHRPDGTPVRMKAQIIIDLP
ncbi:MAG: hypothetical protein WD825_08725 [Gemmatimonadaceae bacterium]